jgi:signal transduction histidine kinase
MPPRGCCAQEEERRRLALELHDETGQSLTALALRAAAIGQCLEREQSPAAAAARQQAERLGALAERTLTEVQALSRQLRPPLLDDLGLPAALRWLAEDAKERLHISVRVRTIVTPSAADDAIVIGDSLPDEPSRLAGEIETALFRIAQECVTNAVRHGQAREVRVLLCYSPACVTLTVVDLGRGFDASVLDGEGKHDTPLRGMGIAGMRERARLIGGRLRLRSRPGHGCVVRITIPMRSDTSRAHLMQVAHQSPAPLDLEGEL